MVIISYLFSSYSVQVSSLDVLKDRLSMYMDLYNEQVRGAHMDLVFFDDAMIHLMKVRQPYYWYALQD